MSSLATLWKGGREGTLSPLEQMKAWALREAQKDLGGEEAVCYKKIAERVSSCEAYGACRHHLRAPYAGAGFLAVASSL